MDIPKLHRRRGVVRASTTRLTSRIRELHPADPEAADLAQQYKEKLIALDAEFKVHHYGIVDVVEDEALADEQEILNTHDDAICELKGMIQKILTHNVIATKTGSRHVQSRRLTHLGRAIDSVIAEVQAIPEDCDDTCLIQQYGDQLAEIKTELKGIHGELLLLALEERDELFNEHNGLTKKIFDCGHNIKKLLDTSEHRIPIRESRGVRLPKLEVPTFDGNVINWSTFWEQFSVSVHSHDSISDPEKLVYLQHALKDGSAKHAIEGLSRSGDNYNEAVECLQQRYDRPRLIHRTHVQMIIETPSLKEGTGKSIA